MISHPIHRSMLSVRKAACGTGQRGLRLEKNMKRVVRKARERLQYLSCCTAQAEHGHAECEGERFCKKDVPTVQEPLQVKSHVRRCVTTSGGQLLSLALSYIIKR